MIISQLSLLQIIDVSNNKIAHFNTDMFYLPNFKYLMIRQNLLSYFEEELQLKGVDMWLLDIRRNPIKVRRGFSFGRRVLKSSVISVMNVVIPSVTKNV